MRGLLMASDLPPWLMIVLMQVIALILGMFLDPLGIILLVLPIFYPVVVALRYDPIWFCVDLHRFCSGQVLMLGGPLFEGQGGFPAEG